LPLKRSKGAVKLRHLHYLVFVWNDNNNTPHCLIRRRGDGDIWSYLYDFPCIETYETDGFDPLLYGLFTPWIGEGASGVIEGEVRQYRHQLSHQQILAAFHIIRLPDKPRIHDSTLMAAAMNQPGNYPYPRLISRFLRDYLTGL
jgi:A/G-specific adenine glycosylase